MATIQLHPPFPTDADNFDSLKTNPQAYSALTDSEVVNKTQLESRIAQIPATPQQQVTGPDSDGNIVTWNNVRQLTFINQAAPIDSEVGRVVLSGTTVNNQSSVVVKIYTAGHVTPQLPSIGSFTVNGATSVNANQGAALAFAWTGVMNATAVSINNGVPAITGIPNGSVNFNVPAGATIGSTITYVLTATGVNGTAQSSVQVTVTSTPQVFARAGWLLRSDTTFPTATDIMNAPASQVYSSATPYTSSVVFPDAVNTVAPSGVVSMFLDSDTYVLNPSAWPQTFDAAFSQQWIDFTRSAVVQNRVVANGRAYHVWQWNDTLAFAAAACRFRILNVA